MPIKEVGTMKETRKRKEYKSPQRKLVNFFEKSRDRWKNKSIAAKQKVKRLQNRVRYLEKSKGHLKNQIKALKEELAIVKSAGPEGTEEIKKRWMGDQ